jgi:uncharacterized SAM-binding protein YcdF (DUF218 family)
LKSPVIVIPDGVKAEGTPPVPVSAPSFVYRAALDRVAAEYADHPILLAPANRFGDAAAEQEAGAAYLESLGRFALTVPPSPATGGHIDTRGNARLLREYLQDYGCWPLPPCILVVARLHARRAALCFKREGFGISEVDAVPYAIPKDEGIVRRAWYYRYPALHSLYEILAYVRDWIRPKSSTHMSSRT